MHIHIIPDLLAEIQRKKKHCVLNTVLTASRQGRSVTPGTVGRGLMHSPSSAGYGWQDEMERCYRFHPGGATWLGANATCADEGAALAVPRDASEARLLVRLREARRDEVRATYPTVMPMGFYWDRSWKTLDGKLLNHPTCICTQILQTK